jgi:hypothetical protein
LNGAVEGSYIYRGLGEMVKMNAINFISTRTSTLQEYSKYLYIALSLNLDLLVLKIRCANCQRMDSVINLVSVSKKVWHFI